MRGFTHTTPLITALITCSLTLAIIKAAAAQSTHDDHHPLPPFSCASTNPSTGSHPFCNVHLSVDERARDLVSRLTLDEKISQLINKASAIPRLGIPYYQWWSEALHGVAVAIGVENGVSFNGTIRAATSFPQVILTAAAFDTNLWYRIAKVIGTEARAIYNEGEAIGMTFWSPNINISGIPGGGGAKKPPEKTRCLPENTQFRSSEGFKATALKAVASKTADFKSLLAASISLPMIWTIGKELIVLRLMLM
ncbi:UNVERIFIED_CONTAM: putative beta-D-xylosidase 7 [Sesamum calycinum]|uniref:Beta-D-xylosidase 7 n=1 Tax=Sesamum calycinum TaxID=2727403 RepID=A0AAW2PBK8_9LAMI